MNNRLELQSKLEEILGSRNVYFQPPETIKLSYPCIVYSRQNGDTQFGDNLPYLYMNAYQIIVIDPDPDSEIPAKIAQLPLSRFDRHYTADNLNHDSFVVYY